MALDDFVKSDLEGSITLTDGNSNTMTLAFDNGDFSGGPFKEVLNEHVKYERRGKFTSVGLGARIYPTFSFTAMVHQFTDATADVLADFVLRNGKFASNQSTFGANHRVYAMDVKMDIEATDFGHSADMTFTLHDCVVTIDSFGEGRPSTISISGEVLGEVTGDLACDEVA